MDGHSYSMSRFSLNDDSDDDLSIPSSSRTRRSALTLNSHPQISSHDMPEYDNLRGIKDERFSSAQVTKKKSSVNMVNEFVWSKHVGNIELFKSQQIFYKLLQKNAESRVESFRANHQR